MLAEQLQDGLYFLPAADEWGGLVGQVGQAHRIGVKGREIGFKIRGDKLVDAFRARHVFEAVLAQIEGGDAFG